MSGKILKCENIAEIVEKKSRFIAYLSPVHSKEEAEEYIKSIKKKHHDARHNCSAYIIGRDRDIFHSSDDGEPSGTAGRPMLEILEKEELYDVVCVVTRYFGGVLLGTGGLVRAYQGACKAAVDEADIVTMVEGKSFALDIDYTAWGKVEHYFKQTDVIIDNLNYGSSISLKAIVDPSLQQSLEDKLTEITQGTATIEWGPIIMVEKANI